MGEAVEGDVLGRRAMMVVPPTRTPVPAQIAAQHSLEGGGLARVGGAKGL